MSLESDPFIFNTVSERLRSGDVLKSIGEIAITGNGFFHAPRERLYRTTRNLFRDTSEAIRFQPPICETVEDISALVEQTEYARTPTLNRMQLTRFVNAFVQFSDRAPISEAMTTPYAQVRDLHDEILDKAERDGPVSYAEQFAAAVEATPHIPSALWNLLITTRQYARWRDTNIIDGFPNYTKDEKLQHMIAWESAVASVQHPNANGFQDTAGDSYYVWTHALARVVFDGLPQKRDAVTKTYAKAFEYGSYGMSALGLLGKVSVYGTMSNHVPASKYGNAIGDGIVSRMEI